MSTANVTQTGQAATVAVTVSRGLQGATGATGAQGTTDYNELDNVPSEFPPESHTHAVSDIVSISSHRLLGRHAGGSGAGQEVTVGNGLEFHGNGIRRSALTGDVTASAGSNSTTIANDAVTNAKLANVATATIKGRITAGTGDPEDLTPAQVIEVIGAATPASVDAQIEAAGLTEYSDVFDALAAGYSAWDAYFDGDKIRTIPESALDTDALAYASARSLPAPQTGRLAGFVAEVKALGLTPIQIIVGRSEFLAVDDTDVIAVIGNDAATAAGTIEAATDGITRTTATRLRYANPQKSTGLTQLSRFAIGSTTSDVTTSASLLSGYTGTSAQGVTLNFIGGQAGGNPISGILTSQDGTSALRNVANFLDPIVKAGRMIPLALSYDGTAGAAKVRMYGGGQTYDDLSTFSPMTAVWNDATEINIGSRQNDTAMAGKVALVMEFSNAMSMAQYRNIIGLVKKYNIADFETDIAMTAIGSSITAGAGGVAGRDLLLPQICYHSGEENWRTPFFRHFAIGGTGADSHITQWNTLAKPWLLEHLGEWERVVHMEFGRNQPVGEQPFSTDPAHRQVLIEKVVATALDAIANGITPYVHSYFYATGVGNADARTASDAYNDTLAARCVLEGLPFFDHRISEPTAFDWPTVDPTLFAADLIHPNAAGYIRLSTAFRTAFPAP
jgi:hypothetical protein